MSMFLSVFVCVPLLSHSRLFSQSFRSICWLHRCLHGVLCYLLALLQASCIIFLADCTGIVVGEMLVSLVFAGSDVSALRTEEGDLGDQVMRLERQNAHIRDSRITFFPEAHKYVLDLNTSIEHTFPCSVSCVAALYFQQFDAIAVCSRYFDKWAVDTSSVYFSRIQSGRAAGQSDDDIRHGTCCAWHANGEKAALDGMLMHKAIEMALNGCAYDYSSIEIGYFHSFVKEYLEPRGWKAFRTEWCIYDVRAGVAGQIDCVFYNASDKTFHIMDWKRSKKILQPDIGLCFGRRGRPPCEGLVDNAWSRYAVQQNLYAEILKRNYGIVATTISLGHFHSDFPNYRVVELPLMAELANEILDTWQGYEATSAQVISPLPLQRSRSRRRSP